MPWEWPVGALCAFALALVSTPAGVSGAVLLLPIQLSVLHVASPAATPTNLVFNLAATPGSLFRFWRERHDTGSLLPFLIAGTVPGVIAGAIIRVELLSSSMAFLLVAAGVLLPLGLWLLLGSQRRVRTRPTLDRRACAMVWVLALAVGCAGGIYGIGGGSLMAPILLAVGFTAYEVAPATLASTFMASLAGIVTYEVLHLAHVGRVAPDWSLAAWLGAGGLLGSYVGAGLQRRLPEASIRRLLGLIACVVAVRYLQEGLQHSRRAAPGAAALARPASLARVRSA